MISADLLREARLRAGLSRADRRGPLPGRSRAAIWEAHSAIGRWERGEVKPSLETLRELIAACGLELGFRLSNADSEAHDLALIRRSLAWTPAQRFEHGQRTARSIGGLWRDASKARG